MMNSREKQLQKKNKIPKTKSTNSNSQPADINFCPQALLQEILSFLPSDQLLKTTRVNKKFYVSAEKVFEAKLCDAQKVSLAEARSAKFKFFNIEKKDEPLLKLILENKGCLTKKDKALVKAISSKEYFHDRSLRNEKKHREGKRDFIPTAFITSTMTVPSIYAGQEKDFVRGKLFAYLYKNRFLFCREFVEIPIVKTYLEEIAPNLSYHASYLFHDRSFSDSKGLQIGDALNLETLLLCCLLSEVIAAKEGEKACQRFIETKLSVLSINARHYIMGHRITNPQEFYALCRLFVKNCQDNYAYYSTNFDNHEHVNANDHKMDSELVRRFYDCYIEYLAQQENLDTKLIEELIREKFAFVEIIRETNEKNSSHSMGR